MIWKYPDNESAGKNEGEEMKPSERISDSMPWGIISAKKEIDALHDRIEALENTSPHFQKLKEKQEPKKLTREQYEALIETLRKELL